MVDGCLTVTNPSTLPYEWVCSKCKLDDIYWHIFNMMYFYNLCKVVVACAFNIHINTTIEVVDGPPCISHVKTPWLFSLFKLQEKDCMKIVLVKEWRWLSSWEIESFLVLSTWIQLGELVRYNEKFQPQEVVIEFVKEIVGDYSFAWTFFGFFFHWIILYFVDVDSSLSHIIRPHMYIKLQYDHNFSLLLIF